MFNPRTNNVFYYKDDSTGKAWLMTFPNCNTLRLLDYANLRRFQRMFAKKWWVIKLRKDRCKSTAAPLFVDCVTFCVFALRNSACTSRLCSQGYIPIGALRFLRLPKNIFSWKILSRKDENQALSTVICFHKSPFSYRRKRGRIFLPVQRFSAPSLIYTKTAENDEINWTWNSTHARAVTSGNFFSSLAHTKTERFN